MDSVLGLNGSQKEQSDPSRPTLNHPSDSRVYQGSLQPASFPSLPKDWISEWETFPSSDGTLQLYSAIHHKRDWKGHRALVVLHGLGEHGGRYLHFPHYVQSAVDAVYCLDHRGHGRAEGLRGHVEQFDSYADDAALALSRIDEHLKKRFGQSKIHLLGHSMGGLIALRTMFKYPSSPVASLSISAPLLGIRVPVPVIKKTAAYALSRIWGKLHMTAELDANQLSHDKEVVEVYQKDRLNHNKVTPQFFVELESAITDTVRRDSGLHIPMQMMIPLQDQIVDPEAALGFFRGLKIRDKVLKTYPSFFHEPFNEIGKERVFEDLVHWINTQNTES